MLNFDMRASHENVLSIANGSLIFVSFYFIFKLSTINNCCEVQCNRNFSNYGPLKAGSLMHATTCLSDKKHFVQVIL